MAKYSKGAQKGVESSMKRMKQGKLRSGNSGKKVTNSKQAIAIGLSEAREKGAKVPAKKAAPKRSAAKKSAAKRSAPKKAAPKKAAAKKSVPKKSAAKRSAPKRSAAKKSAPKKSAPKKSAAKNSAPKKAAAKKSAPKKSAARKSAAKRPAPKKTAATTTGDNRRNEGIVENNQPQQKDERQIPVEENTAVPAKVEDPMAAIDQKAQQKAISKMDRKHNMPLSAHSKGFNRPSGKKPLWNK